MRYLRISLHVSEIDMLVRIGLLREEERHASEALQTAIMSIIYATLDRAVGAQAGGPV